MAEKSKRDAIGIDLGTTYSCVAVWRREQNRVDIIPHEQGNRTTPSCVAFTQTGHFIGEAVRQATAKNIIYDVKRLMGRKFTDPLVQSDIKLWPFEVISGQGDKPMIVAQYKGERKEFTPEQISSFVLTKMQKMAEEYLGGNIKDVVITVPAYFSDLQKQSTIDAGKIAGLNVLQILCEPTAAAMSYGFDRKHSATGTKNVLIFDLGGGTFDISIVEIGNGDVKVKAVKGYSHLGGLNFDNRMVEEFIKEFKEEHGKDIRGNPTALKKLRTACERAKRVLSSQVEAAIDIENLYEGSDFYRTISRSKFERLNEDFFYKCIEVLKECLEDAKIGKSSIDDIVLVGGSTRIPMVQSLLKDFFDGKELCKSINPDEAVAYGAAIQAAYLSGNKVQDVVLHDVIPLSLGTDTAGAVFDVVIPRNTCYPTKREKTYYTAVDNQLSMNINVYQGERVKANENNKLGGFLFVGISPAPKGEGKVTVSFAIDANGILTVSAEDKKTGNRMEMTIKNGLDRLSNEDIRKMVQDAEAYRKDDEKYKNRAKAKNALDVVIYDVRKSLQCNKGIDSGGRRKIEDVIEKIIKWLANSHPATEDQFDSEYKKYTAELNTIVAKVSKYQKPVKTRSDPSSSSYSFGKHLGVTLKVSMEILNIVGLFSGLDISPIIYLIASMC